MTFDLIHRLRSHRDPNGELGLLFGKEDGRTVINNRGVVLIDEADVHLHPTWQREIGPWLRRLFPKMQFIVTTHSPLVCHAAEHGSVMLLPRPGSGDEPRMLEGEELARVVHGDVLTALDTPAFGLHRTRSATSQAQLEELARLNVKSLHSKLTKAEQRRRDELRAQLPSAAPIEPTGT